jgi:hypothetical protein
MSSQASILAQMSLLSIVGKLDNQGSLRSIHDFDAIKLFDGLHCGISEFKAQERGALARSIGIPNHIDF